MDTWRLPPEDLILPESDLHVYRANLDRPKEALVGLGGLLSDDERARADRFHFERDRNRFIVGRGILRTIIGRYLRISPADVAFEYGEHGKPGLMASMGGTDLEFNVAHSREMALYAFARKRMIGVDVEYCHPLRDVEAIVARFFSAQEGEVFFRLPAEQHREAFFNCWTRKEAFIKAIGDGLSFPLRRFSVAFAPGEVAQLLEIVGDAREAASWWITSLEPGPEYAAAVAVKGDVGRLARWDWPG